LPERKSAPYGSWKSPITAELFASSYIGVQEPQVDGESIYWKELRPREAGRNVVVREDTDGSRVEVTPKEFNVRTTVHEYGGGDYLVNKGRVYFSNFKDQRLYRLEGIGSAPEPLTPGDVDVRYADGIVDPRRNRLIIVREDHTVNAPQAVNTIVSIGLPQGGAGHVLVSGNDFYSTPRLSPDNSRLAWLTWNHPNMPWDGTELWVGDQDADGAISSKQLVAGGTEESIFQPEWSPDGTLYFVSDKTGWWNLYRWADRKVEPVYARNAEFGLPQWQFSERSYVFDSANRIVCAYIEKGISHVGLVDPENGRLTEVEAPYTDVYSITGGPGYVLLLAGSPSLPLSLVKLDLKTLQTQVVRRAREETIDPGYISNPETIEFPTEQGKTAHAFFYPPTNKDYNAPRAERPPLLVMSHGGPTGSAGTTLRYGIQYWTSHGIAVVDVDYGGSTGYGRDYRLRLNGKWGIVDVDDCLNSARYLVKRGDVDGNRLAITGGSAGGYTTLCAVTFRKFFQAGASYYGISDLEALAKDTHKFESRYSDRLVGPYPERADLYRARSAINYTDQVSCPMILFQGLEDKVVPPNQSEKFYEAVRKKGFPAAYLSFEGEQHGFRKSENMRRSIEAELYFYSRIFGFDPADQIEPVKIENLESYQQQQKPRLQTVEA